MGIDPLSYCTHGAHHRSPTCRNTHPSFFPLSLSPFILTCLWCHSPVPWDHQGRNPTVKQDHIVVTSWVQETPPPGAVIECRPAEQMCSDAPSSERKAPQPAAYYGCRINSHRKTHDLWLFLLMTSQWDHRSWPLRLTPFPLKSRDRCENNSLCNMLMTVLTKFLLNLCVKGFARGDEPHGEVLLDSAVFFCSVELYIFSACWFSLVHPHPSYHHSVLAAAFFWVERLK